MIAAQLAGLVALETLEFRLFINFPTISATTVLADLNEAAWMGYVPFAVAPGSWLTPILDSADNAVSTANPVASFLNTSGGVQSATGWFVTGLTSGVLYAAEVFTPGFLLQDGETAVAFPVLIVTTK